MSIRKAPASSASCVHHRFACALISILLLAICAVAQQSGQRRRVPSMTDDDVRQPVAATPEDSKDAKPGDGKAEAGKPEAVTGEKKDVSADEAAWRERVGQARERPKALERGGEEGE